MKLTSVSYFFIVFFSLLFFKIQAQEQQLFRGKVVDYKQQPIYLATIHMEALDLKTTSTIDGEFTVRFPKGITSIQIQITVVGKKSIQAQIQPNKPQKFVTQDLSYTLSEVHILPEIKRTNASNSSIVFNEEAIQRLQGFSIMDILNTLPGKASVAPNINRPQTANLRGNFSEDYAFNNSLGVAVVMDGIRLSNDANMQSRSASQFGMRGSLLAGVNNSSSGDVAFQGIDLRDIPVETIERVEIIQGIASAEYDELTDGAILIDRKAGRTPLSFTTNVNGGSSNFSLSKGTQLSKKLGALNIGFNYAISNPNPRDKVKQYNRVTGSLMWSTKFSSQIRNTFSLDVFKTLDQMKIDPDDANNERSYSKGNGIRLSNRLNWNAQHPVAENISWSISYSQSKQETYKQWLLNQTPRGYAYKDTTGIYEGVVLAGRYLAEEEIIGSPITAATTLKASTNFSTGSLLHALSYGLSINYSNNGGKGIIADPDKPRWINQSGQNARPYSFEYLDPLLNYGAFITDNFALKIGSKTLRSNLGLRLDQQNGAWSFQPRLSTQLEWNSHWNFKAAYGVSSKSPTMAHRYPAPTFLDIPLILAFNSEDALYLVYTEKFVADNSKLKPAKSSQFEFGINYKDSFIASSLTVYTKHNRGGFSSSKQYKNFFLPDYSYAYDEQRKKIVYEQAGTFTNYASYGNYAIENIQNSATVGVDWMLSTKKINALQTSFTVSHSLSSSKEDLKRLEVTYIATPITVDGKQISHLLFPPSSNDRITNFMSKVGTSTHIPQLGFVVSTNLDLFWFTKSASNFEQKMQQAVGYIDNQGISGFFTQQTATIPVRDLSLVANRRKMVYACLNLSVAKEIKKHLRIAVSAYNVLNIQPEQRIYSTSNTEDYIISTYNAPLSITGGLTYKF